MTDDRPKPFMVRRERGFYNGKFSYEDFNFPTMDEAQAFYTASIQAEIEIISKTQGRPITNFYLYDRTQKKPFNDCVIKRDVVEKDMQSGEVVCHAYEPPKPMPMPKMEYPKPDANAQWGVVSGINRKHWGTP